MNSYYHKYVKITIEDSVFDEIVQITNKYTDFEPRGSYAFDGKQKIPQTGQRESKSHLFSDPELIDILEQIIRTVNIQADWNFYITAFEQTQHIKYDEGSYFKWHIDENNWVPGKSAYNLMKKLSFSILLNDDYTGGEFDIFTTKQETLDLKKKDMLIFHSDILHQVRPVTSGTRYSLVGWIQGPPWR
jgi:PKHD-type hydroxylase